jgi:hypothetical protein
LTRAGTDFAGYRFALDRTEVYAAINTAERAQCSRKPLSRNLTDHQEDGNVIKWGPEIKHLLDCKTRPHPLPILSFNVCVIDGVFEPDPGQGARFIKVAELDAGDAAAVPTRVRHRILRAFVRRGILDKDDRRGMEQWGHGGGFSLDATVRIAVNDRHGLERLLRYCARPPFAADRIEELDRHRLIYHLPRPGSDGRTQLILSPLELIERIAALVPPPRQH